MIPPASDLTFTVREDDVMVGTNPEMADYDNRRGLLFGRMHYIVAEAATGARWNHSATAFTYKGRIINRDEDTDPESMYNFTVHSQYSPEQLEALADHLNNGPGLILADHWMEGIPCYGSHDYSAGDWERKSWEIENRDR